LDTVLIKFSIIKKEEVKLYLVLSLKNKLKLICMRVVRLSTCSWIGRSI